MSGRHWVVMVASDLLQYRGVRTDSSSSPPPIIMNSPYLTNSQIEELNEFGVIELTDELMSIINQWVDEDFELNLD